MKLHTTASESICGSASIVAMKLTSRIFLLAVLLGVCAGASRAQTGSIQFDAHIRASGGADEPVRGANFYLLRKSYADIEAEAKTVVPPVKMDDFIDKLDVSKELKVWMKKNKRVHLSGEDFIKLITPDDMIIVPEFYKDYVDRLQGDQTVTIPKPKYNDKDKDKDPTKYEELLAEYKKAIKQFLIANPTSSQGLDLGLEEVDPGHKWDVMVTKNKGALDREVTALAEGKYLAARTQSDLDGRGYFRGIPAGTYWLSTLDVDELAGEDHERWDAPLVVAASRETYISLSNINAVQASATNP
jgi:hypothetical protein